MPRDNKPAHEIRVRMIKATIWKNGEDGKPFYSVNIGRIYNANRKKDPNEKPDWQTSDSFNLDDLPLVEKVSARAFSWICQQEERARDAKRRATEAEA